MSGFPKKINQKENKTNNNIENFLLNLEILEKI